VTQLDEQNGHLFEAIRQYQADHRSVGDGATDGVLAFLEVHMEGHLALEEAYLEQVRFPGLTEHRGAHRAFVNQLHAFSARRAAGDSGVSLELPRLLLAWVREHVLREDAVWSEYAQANRRRTARA
jgi:hemerythrin